MPQARCDRELFVDAAPFASAFDASLRSVTTFLIDARFLSALLTLTLVFVFAYLASAAHLIGLKAIDATASLPSRIEVDVNWSSVYTCLRSSTSRLVGLARAAHRVDQIIHDRAISILSCALDPLRVARTVASCLVSLVSRSAPP
eukprot:6090960-Pleurochrysis_carterae.AAC.1